MRKATRIRPRLLAANKTQMSSAGNDQWLESGIAAVKAGNRESARKLLTKAVRADERNELAWLWLSTAVESEEEKRICLDNVIALNPDNKSALHALARLDETPSGAAAMPAKALPPIDRGAVEVGAPVPAGAQADSPAEAPAKLHPHAGQASSAFRDVWDTDDDICAYCAAKVAESDQTCPNCKHVLIRKMYRYPATAALHLYWLLLLALALLLVLQSNVKLSSDRDGFAALLHLGLAIGFFTTTVGVYFRLNWGHILSTLLLIVTVVITASNLVIPLDLSSMAAGGADLALVGFAQSVTKGARIAFLVIQLIVAAAALMYSVFRIAPEFERVQSRLVAKLNRGAKTAVDHQLNAKRFEQDGMIASAVLHWQQATIIDSKRVNNYLNLARAYGRLGFQERALNVLESTSKVPMSPQARVRIGRLIQRLERQTAAAKQEI